MDHLSPLTYPSILKVELLVYRRRITFGRFQGADGSPPLVERCILCGETLLKVGLFMVCFLSTLQESTSFSLKTWLL